MKKITLLGSTGSIGTQCLDIVRENRGKYKVTALTCGRNVSLFEKQIEEFAPELAVTAAEEDAITLRKRFPDLEIMWGEEGLSAAAGAASDMVVNALVGMRGMIPTFEAIKAGRDVALANKETLVAGGRVIMDAARNKGIRLLPVDSEHSAIFQCLEGNRPAPGIKRETQTETKRPPRRILLTASGGPFRGADLETLKKVTVKDALKHPNWSMGKKITIDSATMMNKGLEVIEAQWLFDVPPGKIQVLIHPQSILHSAVEFEDGAVIGQMGTPDMRIPISFALAYPERLPNDRPSLDFFREASELTFEKPDMEVFRCLKLAYEAAEAGGTYPAAMNGANEVLVDAFLTGKISFVDIQKNIEIILNEHKPEYNINLEDILEADSTARRRARELTRP